MNSGKEHHHVRRGFSLAFWKKKRRSNREQISDCATETYTVIDTMITLYNSLSMFVNYPY